MKSTDLLILLACAGMVVIAATLFIRKPAAAAPVQPLRDPIFTPPAPSAAAVSRYGDDAAAYNQAGY